MSEIDAALKILGLKPSSIRTINVFGKRSEAERTYHKFITSMSSNGGDLNESLKKANAELRILEAWKTLCYERMKYHICEVCSRLTKIEHHHCPECNCILQKKISWPEKDIGVERITCQKCDYKKTRRGDDPRSPG